jgi:hypothetical protein
MFEGDYDSANKTITYTAQIETAPDIRLRRLATTRIA